MLYPTKAVYVFRTTNDDIPQGRYHNTKSGAHASLNSAWTAGFQFSRKFQATVPVSTSSRSYSFPSSGCLHTHIELTFGKSLDWIHGSENLIVARAAYYQLTNPGFYVSFETSRRQGSTWSGLTFFTARIYVCVLFEPIFIQCHLVFYLTLVTGNHWNAVETWILHPAAALWSSVVKVWWFTR